MENSLVTYGDARIKIFNFEKQKRKDRPIRRKAPENLIRRAGGLKRCTDLKLIFFNFFASSNLTRRYN